MFNKTKFDISHENFDIFFSKHLPSLTSAAKEQLPRDIAFSLYRGQHPNNKNAVKLNFIAKLWILWKCFKKRIWIVVEDENGMSAEEFVKLSKAVKRKRAANEFVEDEQMQLHFVTGDKELGDTLEFLNRKVYSSAMYNYLLKTKNTEQNDTAKWKEQMEYIVERFFMWESNKKKWVVETGVSVAEFQVLMYCYHGRPVKGSYLYKVALKNAYQCSTRLVKEAFGTLQHRGFLRKEGNSKGATMQITSLGTEFINKIMAKYVLYQ